MKKTTKLLYISLFCSLFPCIVASAWWFFISPIFRSNHPISNAFAAVFNYVISNITLCWLLAAILLVAAIISGRKSGQNKPLLITSIIILSIEVIITVLFVLLAIP